MILVVLALLLSFPLASRASGYPVSLAAKRWKPDRQWLKGAICVHEKESTRWHFDNPPYSGGFQFTVGTWQRVGGKGRASQWSPREQFYRAWLIWKQDHNSWREWPLTSRACGLS